MASWGPKLYQNDLAVFIKNEYKDNLHRGKAGEEITQMLIKIVRRNYPIVMMLLCFGLLWRILNGNSADWKIS